MVCFLVAVLLHEAAHALLLYLCHVPVIGFRLCICGAVIQTQLCSYRDELLCAAAGPVCNLILLICFLRINPVLSIVNAVLATVNLLPLYPLDGGRILYALLMMHMDPTRASICMRYVAVVVCCLLMLSVCWLTIVGQAGIWPIFAALVLLCRAGQGKIPCHK